MAAPVGIGRPDVGGVNDRASKDRTAKKRVRPDTRRILRHVRDKRLGHIAFGDVVGAVAIDREQPAEIRFAEPHRLFEHRVEDRLKLARRGVDDRQDLGGRGLLLQRFRKRSITFGKLALQIAYKLLGMG